MRSGTASPSLTPLLFLDTGACTQSQTLRTCAGDCMKGVTQINLIETGWVGQQFTFQASICPPLNWLACQSGICGRRDIVLRLLRTGNGGGGQLHRDWGMCPHCSAGSKPDWVTALNLGAAIANRLDEVCISMLGSCLVTWLRWAGYRNTSREWMPSILCKIWSDSIGVNLWRAAFLVNTSERLTKKLVWDMWVTKVGTFMNDLE